MAVIKNVVLAGVTGNLGPAILEAVQSAGLFNITVFTRHGSTAPVHKGVKVVPVDYDSVADLTSKLEGADAVVSSLGITALEQQKNLIKAAAAAKVVRFIPSEFGSDLDNPAARRLPVFAWKVASQELLKSLASEDSITYTFVYTGPFLDWGLKAGFIQEPRSKRAVLYDGGDRLFSTTSLSGIGKAVVSVLTHPTETENRSVRVAEAAISLKELLALAQEVVGSDGWTITEASTSEKAEEALAKIKEGTANREAFTALIHKAVWGADNGGWFSETDNELLGIQQLDKEGVKKVIQDVVDGKL
ncbi:hypothetical protein BDW66DRAFT_155768 [Aspergillus desertorum]